MAAAIEAARFGASVVLLDENPRPGGQIYRDVTRNDCEEKGYLGPDYWRGKQLAASFSASNIDYAPRATVWSVESPPDSDAQTRHSVCVTIGNMARMIESSAVILATGAQERPMPLPGWTLPGVMTAGAAQIALKTIGAIPVGPTILAGCGPLLYLLASQLIDAGVNDLTLLDTAQSLFRTSVMRQLPQFLFSSYLLKGIGLLLKVRRRANIVSDIRSIAIIGLGSVQGVRFVSGNKEHFMPANSVLLHQGVIPSINLINAAGAELTWNENQRTFQPIADQVGRTTKPGIYVAGDGGGIEGAQAAEVRGRIAALAAVSDLGFVSPRAVEAPINSLNRQARYLARGRKFLDALYAPRQSFLKPSNPETLVCRCEEITAGKLREVIALGPPGPNQLKTFVRCGMGQCQGRLCAATITEIMADEIHVEPSVIGTFRFRSPVKPVRLGELAHLPHTVRAQQAVTGRDPIEQKNKPVDRST